MLPLLALSNLILALELKLTCLNRAMIGLGAVISIVAMVNLADMVSIGTMDDLSSMIGLL